MDVETVDTDVFFHGHFIEYAKALGYKCKIGRCLGYAYMGMQAILSEDMRTFDKRLELLMSINVCEIADKIDQVRKKSAAMGLKALTEAERDVLDIPAFIEGVLIAASPASYRYLFEEGTKSTSEIHRTNIVASVIMSKTIQDKIKDEKMFSSTDLQNMFFDEHSLVLFLKNVKSLTKNTTYPFAMMMHDHFVFGHAITIGYDGNHWIYIDIDNSPTLYLSNEEELAKKVCKAFGVTKNKTLLLGIQIYVTADHEKEFVDARHDINASEQWKNFTQISKKEKKLTEAIIRNDAKTVKELLLTLDKNEINQPLVNGKTALYMAVYAGHIDIVKILLEIEGIDPNQADLFGATPLGMAVGCNQFYIVEALLTAKAAKSIDLNQEISYMYNSHQHDYCDCAAIKKHIVKFEKIFRRPLVIAEQLCHKRIEQLLKQHVDLANGSSFENNIYPIKTFTPHLIRQQNEIDNSREDNNRQENNKIM